MSAKTAQLTRTGRDSLALALFRASHPRQALLTAAALGAAAAVSGRSTREVLLVVATVLTGQAILGWQNDVVDTARDRENGREDKPIVRHQVDRGTVMYAALVAILLVVPLSIANGVESGIAHLAFLAVAILTNFGLLRRTRFSFVPWMLSFALLPAFLSYGGYGGEGAGGPPTIALTVLTGLLGIGVHLLVSLPGLVQDNRDDIRHLPLLLALRTGAPRLLLISGLYTAAVSAGMVVAALSTGLVQ